MCAMQKITEEELAKLQKKYGFKFCKIKNSDVVNICKSKSDRVDIITKEDFLAALKKRKLAVYKSDNDFLKVMKDKK